MRYCFVFIFIIAINPAFAQQGKTNVSGTIIDKASQQPIEFVTVVLLDKKDSSKY